MDNVEVSVIVVHKDKYPQLRSCLESLYRQTTGLRFEVIIVDNASEDDSVKRIARDFPAVTVVQAGSNLGFGRGNNLGVKNSSGDYLLFLNDDTVFLNNAVKDFADFATTHPELRIGAVGPLLQNKNGELAHSFGKFPRPFSQLSIYMDKLLSVGRERRIADAARHSSGTWVGVDFVTGAAMFVPRSVIEEVGAFDPGFFLYFEETELQHRMARAGYGRYILFGPRVIHLEGGGAPRSNWRRIQTYLGMFLYYRKTQTRAGYILFRIFLPLFVGIHFFHPSFSIRENLEFIRACQHALSSGKVRVKSAGR
jgi:GT2 family glycosyltransferase